MERERNYSERDLDDAFDAGRREAARTIAAARAATRPGPDFAKIFAIIAIIVMVGIMVLTFIGVNPAARLSWSPEVIPAVVAPAPRSAAPVSVPQPAPAVVIQSVPPEQAAQPVTIPQPAPVAPPDTNTVDSVAPAPAPIVIVSHEGYQQPVITGSGACKVAALGARRCTK